ncbi:MAG: hypothetical protein ACD_51C00280G0002 [uncultured bacterium]|nr:MAG: hypothetical protein ACD_51C00280G0002 [uncultured bacterium]
MPNVFTKTTTVGYGSRIMKSIVGVLLGIALFIGSFAVLYWNEGRADLSKIAVTATDISVDATVAVDGSLVSVSDVLSSTETLGDNYLVAGSYIAVGRIVEMYSWDQETDSSSNTNVGGSETTTTTYNYKNIWTEYPADSTSFEYSADHYNPAKAIESVEKRVTSATVGQYSVDIANVVLPEFSAVTLTDQNIVLPQVSDMTAKLSGGYIYVGKGTPEVPQVGDLRIKYEVLNTGGNVTVFGKLSGGAIASYMDEDGNTLFRIFNATREDAIVILHAEYVTSLWLLRALGFVMMWFGLMLIFAPLSTVLDVLPFLGGVSRFIIGAITFVVSVVFAGVTILVSMVVHSVIALVVVAVLAIASVVLIGKKVASKKSGGIMQKS